MALTRSKSEKAKKYGTPSAPSPTAQKSSPTSPRATGGTPSAPSPTAQKTSSPKSYGITQTTTGQTVQTQFGTFTSNLAKTIIHGAFTAATKQEKVEIEINARLGGKDISQLPSGTQIGILNLQEEKKELEIEIISNVEKAKEADLSASTKQIINAINENKVFTPDWFQNNITWVQTGQTTNKEFLDAYYNLANQGIIYSTPTESIIEEIIIEEPEIKETWWVIRPSGLIEHVTVTQKFVDTMTAQGWIFSKDKPTIEEPQNQNISIVFYIGKGGDLKTHFGINSIVVTPDEAELLAGWLYQNYNTKIIFVMNRLTDDIRTHTLQQIKDLIIQKLKDDKPDSDDIDDDDIKKPQELGIMGAGVAGAIGILILLGFITDSRRKK